MAQPKLILTNLDGEGYFEFQYFPDKSRTSDRLNWEEQNTTIGEQPLFYKNRSPRQIDFEELYLDSTDTNESLTPKVEQLEKLLEELAERGAPPAILAAWGDRKERCVITDLETEEVFFNTEGHPIRVKIRLNLKRIQKYGSNVDVQYQGGVSRPRRV
jgi:hypothetical protein